MNGLVWVSKKSLNRIMGESSKDASRQLLITRTASFSSAHRMHSNKLSHSENLDVFGKCNHVHGHNYTVEVSIKGNVDPVTGMVLNITIVQEALDKILKQLDHRNIVTRNIYIRIWILNISRIVLVLLKTFVSLFMISLRYICRNQIDTFYTMYGFGRLIRILLHILVSEIYLILPNILILK